jgi:hypothetical protein
MRRHAPVDVATPHFRDAAAAACSPARSASELPPPRHALAIAPPLRVSASHARACRERRHTRCRFFFVACLLPGFFLSPDLPPFFCRRFFDARLSFHSIFAFSRQMPPDAAFPLAFAIHAATISIIFFDYASYFISSPVSIAPMLPYAIDAVTDAAAVAASPRCYAAPPRRADAPAAAHAAAASHATRRHAYADCRQDARGFRRAAIRRHADVAFFDY